MFDNTARKSIFFAQIAKIVGHDGYALRNAAVRQGGRDGRFFRGRPPGRRQRVFGLAPGRPARGFAGDPAAQPLDPPYRADRGGPALLRAREPDRRRRGRGERGGGRARRGAARHAQAQRAGGLRAALRHALYAGVPRDPSGGPGRAHRDRSLCRPDRGGGRSRDPHRRAQPVDLYRAQARHHRPGAVREPGVSGAPRTAGPAGGARAAQLHRAAPPPRRGRLGADRRRRQFRGARLRQFRVEQLGRHRRGDDRRNRHRPLAGLDGGARDPGGEGRGAAPRIPRPPDRPGRRGLCGVSPRAEPVGQGPRLRRLPRPQVPRASPISGSGSRCPTPENRHDRARRRRSTSTSISSRPTATSPPRGSGRSARNTAAP